MNTSDLKSFNYLESGDILFSQYATIKSSNIIDPGVYNVEYDDYPENKVRLKMLLDEEEPKIYSFPDKIKLDELFSVFFESETLSKVNKLGYNHKVGILLYGKEGTGKSSILKHYYSSIIKKYNAIVFHIIPKNYNISKCWEFVKMVRKIQNNPIIIMLEEVDGYLKDAAMEAFIKTILDGANSINNCVFMGTTNYIDNIPEAIKNRPSRFKYCFNIEGVQDSKEIFDIITKLIGALYKPEEIKVWATELSGSSVDIIKQFCLDKLLDLKIHQSTKRKIGFKL